MHTLLYISTPSTRKGSHAENKAPHGRKQRFFSNVLNFVVFSYTLFRKPNLISVFKQCQSNTQMSVVVVIFFEGGSMRRSLNLEKLHKALRSVQFLASFISFYFEILSYLACGEKIIRLASKNSVRLGEKSASDF